MASRYIVIIFLALLSAAICGYIAHKNGKDPWSWALGGLLLNVFIFAVFFMARNVKETKLKPQKGD